MFNEKFKLILQEQEKIQWSGNVNVGANIMKGLIPFMTSMILLGAFFGVGGGGIWYGANYGKGQINVVNDVLLILIPIWIILLAAYFIVNFLNSKNTFFCITDKRIIKRSGAFGDKFIHYSLKNVGTVSVAGSMFDNKGEDGSANLLVVIKDFYNNTASMNSLRVKSLQGAYEAYKMLSKTVEGNNEFLRIKSEK
ncbi:MAG: hypothetical protein WCP11_01520 [Candidatus Saccharibacteria bacterium]